MLINDEIWSDEVGEESVEEVMYSIFGFVPVDLLALGVQGLFVLKYGDGYFVNSIFMPNCQI